SVPKTTAAANDVAARNYCVADDTCEVQPCPVETEEDTQAVESQVDVSWPSTLRAQINYLFLAPVMLPLYYTLPDTKNPACFTVIFFVCFSFFYKDTIIPAFEE
ncbi:unnamed protein product, partial [Gongylonema pulchrum]|uniref:Pecanex-like protein n=1 Tax=Gongylonema pulchrum TaxID=637853 RepID=A0A183EJC5_9BILA